jgi:hypothetical protein
VQTTNIGIKWALQTDRKTSSFVTSGSSLSRLRADISKDTAHERIQHCTRDFSSLSLPTQKFVNVRARLISFRNVGHIFFFNLKLHGNLIKEDFL